MCVGGGRGLGAAPTGGFYINICVATRVNDDVDLAIQGSLFLAFHKDYCATVPVSGRARPALRNNPIRYNAAAW